MEDRFTAAERSAAWDHAARAVGEATAQVRGLGGADPADAVWAVGDTLHAAAAVLGSRILREAADGYDRAARAPFGRIPVSTSAGNSLRRAARLLTAYGSVTSDPSFRPVVLITRLAVLVEAVAVFRQTQERVTQAASALNAAERLHAARWSYVAPTTGDRLAGRSAATLAGGGFPESPHLVSAEGTGRRFRFQVRRRQPGRDVGHDTTEYEDSKEVHDGHAGCVSRCTRRCGQPFVSAPGTAGVAGHGCGHDGGPAEGTGERLEGRS